MTKRKIKFLPVFLIACLCLVASLGFATFNAFAENGDNNSNACFQEDEGPSVKFNVNDSSYGSISPSEGFSVPEYPRTSPFVGDNNELIIGDHIIKPIPHEKDQHIYVFDCWTRSDQEVLNSVIVKDVTFTANFNCLPCATINFHVNNEKYGSLSSNEPIYAPIHTKMTISNNQIMIGDEVVTAIPTKGDKKIGYKFIEWTTSFANNCEGEVTGDMDITANFEQVNTPKVSVLINPEQQGWAVLENTIPETVYYGSRVEYVCYDRWGYIKVYDGEALQGEACVKPVKDDDFDYKFKEWICSIGELPTYICDDITFQANLTRDEQKFVDIKTDGCSMKAFELSVEKGATWHIESAHVTAWGAFVPTQIVVMKDGQTKGFFSCNDTKIGEFNKVFLNGVEIHEGDAITTSGTLSAAYNK